MNSNYHLILALLLAMIAPAGLLLTRHELRRLREKVVQELLDTVFAGEEQLPQLSLVLARYRRSGDSRQSRLQPATGAALFVLVGFLGFLLLLTPLTAMLGERGALQPGLANALIWMMPLEELQAPDLVRLQPEALRTLAVVGFAFLGGYVFQLNYLIRAALNQELSALSFVRSSLRLIIGVIVGLILFRTLDAAVDAGGTAAFGGALGGAFVAGYWPELGIARLGRALKVRLKMVDDDALAVSKLVPLEVVDGIDGEVSFRLQENNIYDVQNLATVNPLILYAETPFGIFECFDWVLQAQLCMVVGPSTFHLLKQHNVRTIFDLERAVLSHGAPVSYVQAIGTILFANPDARFGALVGIVAGDAASTISPDIVRHVVAIICDDLHVHRLRALWATLLRNTAGQDDPTYPWLYETGWLPGERADTSEELPPPQELELAEAVLSAERFRAARAADDKDPQLPALRNACLDRVTSLARYGASAKLRLRRLWDPEARGKRVNEHSLEPFHGDPDFVALLA